MLWHTWQALWNPLDTQRACRLGRAMRLTLVSPSASTALTPTL